MPLQRRKEMFTFTKVSPQALSVFHAKLIVNPSRVRKKAESTEDVILQTRGRRPQFGGSQSVILRSCFQRGFLNAARTWKTLDKENEKDTTILCLKFSGREQHLKLLSQTSTENIHFSLSTLSISMESILILCVMFNTC